jgi:four helix bundle suffix protein
LRSFQVATVIYDATVSFCDRFIDQKSRTHDQMVQAARSGRQNISEGSRGAATSSQTELRLVSTARMSLEELLLDYEDYIRQNGHRKWEPNDPEALRVRAIGSVYDQSDQSDQTDPLKHYQRYAYYLEHKNPAMVANTLLCLIHQANYLLDQQITALERQFVEEGGYSEQLATLRIARRETQPTQPNTRAPACPMCGKPLVLRTARKGPRAGSQFWGCSAYPQCKGTLPLDAPRSDRSV